MTIHILEIFSSLVLKEAIHILKRAYKFGDGIHPNLPPFVIAKRLDWCIQHLYRNQAC